MSEHLRESLQHKVWLLEAAKEREAILNDKLTVLKEDLRKRDEKLSLQKRTIATLKKDLAKQDSQIAQLESQIGALNKSSDRWAIDRKKLLEAVDILNRDRNQKQMVIDMLIQNR